MGRTAQGFATLRSGVFLFYSAREEKRRRQNDNIQIPDSGNREDCVGVTQQRINLAKIKTARTAALGEESSQGTDNKEAGLSGK